MRNSDYYPAGAANDPNAPYNQVDPPEIEKELSATVVLNKDTLVTTDKVYYDGDDWVICEDVSLRDVFSDNFIDIPTLLAELVKWNEEVNVIGDIPNYENTYLTRKEVSELIGVSLMTLHRWEKDKVLVPVRFGHSVRYKLSDIQKMGADDDE